MKKLFSQLIVVIIVILTLFSYSCKKDSNSTNPKTVQGAISLQVKAMHHSFEVPFIMVYLERNVTDFPGKDSTVYDYKAMTDGYGNVTFEHLYPGNYYIYSSGYDPLVQVNVVGYMPVILDKDHLVDNVANITLMVSE